MTTIKSTIIWTIIFFVALTLLTMKRAAASDGFDIYGFPFTFYDHFAGKCDDCYSKFGFKPIYLLADMLFAMTFVFLVTLLKKKLTQIFNENN